MFGYDRLFNQPSLLHQPAFSLAYVKAAGNEEND
jgi:hypothetical protein